MHNIHDIKLIFNQNILYLKCNLKWDIQNTKTKVINQHKNDIVMCNPWKRTFTLAPLAPLTMISPNNIVSKS
jgi:hypothetical protein